MFLYGGRNFIFNCSTITKEIIMKKAGQCFRKLVAAILVAGMFLPATAQATEWKEYLK